jgi:hypothetical protein
MRRRLVFVVSGGWLIAAACSLNPQPLPPDGPTYDAGPGGTDFGGSDASGGSDVTANPAPGTEGGALGDDAAVIGDAEAGSDTDADDGGDGESDAATDADLDAADAGD